MTNKEYTNQIEMIELYGDRPQLKSIEEQEQIIINKLNEQKDLF